MVLCVQCNVRIPGGIDGFRKHIAERDHKPPYKCSEDDCQGRKFQVRSSLIRHLKDHHNQDDLDSASMEESELDDPIGLAPIPPSHSIPSPAMEGSGSSEIGMDEMSHQEDSTGTDGSWDFESTIERAAALMILRMRKRGNVPGTVISIVIEETQKLIFDILSATKNEVSSKLKEDGHIDEGVINRCVDSLSLSDPFRRLRSKEQQMSYFEKHFNLVQPIPKFLGYRYDQRLDKLTGKYEQVQVPCNFQYIPITKTLTAVLNNPVLFKLIHEEKASSDGRYRSFLDGARAQSNTLIAHHPHTLRLVLYCDDFECVNPLGSKTSIHKIMGVYFVIQNLPPEENSRLRSVHVAAYAYNEDLKNNRGLDTILEPFFEELEELESEDGVVVEVNGQPFVLRATLIACAADGLAAHELLGLSAPGSGKFCRDCMVSRSQLHADILAMGEPRTRAAHLNHIEEVKNQGAVAQKRYGVSKDCLLVRKPKFANSPDIVMKDGMHDILRGIAQMEIKLTLTEFCSIEKYFDAAYINARIETFDYGLPDMKNKPSANFNDRNLSTTSSYTLHQTAAQTWCLLRIFPFLISHKVPKDNKHLQLLVLLKRISDIVFSAAVSESDVDLLQKLILEHHRLFFILYPPEQSGNVEREEQDSDEEWDSDGQELGQQDPDDILPAANEPGIVENRFETDPGPSSAPQNSEVQRGRKERKKVRPVNKHHHLLHYPSMIRNFGPAVLYWCMRFEGKHEIAKRMAAICCNFKNLPLTLADIHQINHAAELLETHRPVKEDVSFSAGAPTTAGGSRHFAALSAVGLERTDVVREVKALKIGGFEYRQGLFVTLPLILNELPLFGCILDIYVCNEQLYFVVEAWETQLYDTSFGAYLIAQTDSPPFPPHQNIAGRHLTRLKSFSELAQFGLTLGDIWDLEDILSKELEVDNTVANFDMTNAPTDELDEERVSRSSDNDSMSEISLNSDNQNVNTESVDGQADETIDKALLEFTTQDVIENMSHYEKIVANNRISLYKALIAEGIPAKKPEFSDGPLVSEKTGHSKNLKEKCKEKSKEKCIDEDDRPAKKAATSKVHRGLKNKIPLRPEHEAFLSAKNVSDEHKAFMKDFLETPVNYRFTIQDIIKDKRDFEDAEATLKAGKALFNKDLKLFTEILIEHLYSLVANPNLVTCEMREGLAISVIASFPQFGQKIVRPDDKPWTWLYNRAHNTGKFANVIASKQRAQDEPRARGGGAKKRKPQKTQPESNTLITTVDDIPLSKEAKYLKLLMPLESSKANIITQMKLTFQERKSLIQKYSVHSCLLLDAFPHLKSFQGEMIELDFGLRYPDKSDKLLKEFHDLVPKLLSLARKDTAKYNPKDCFMFSDDNLNAIIILSKFLPKPKRCYPWECNMNSVPLIDDFFQVVSVGSNITYELEQKRSEANHPIQPYIVAVGHPRCLGKLYLVLGDSHSVELPSGVLPLKAVDLLFKSHFVLQSHYCLGWKNVFRFLECQIYEMPPENCRLATFADKFIELTQMDD